MEGGSTTNGGRSTDGGWRMEDGDGSWKMKDGRRSKRGTEGWRKKYRGVEGGVQREVDGGKST